jgi:CheY-like chemotaxis protein
MSLELAVDNTIGNGQGPFPVLVVDDDIDQSLEITEFLNERGIRACFEVEPESAVAGIEKYRPRIVLLDVNMPGLDGLRVTEIVRNLNYNGVILLMSGDMDALRRANQASPNVFAVLSKPIPLPVLERYVRGVLLRDADPQ